MNESILIRTYNPTLNQIKRILKWCISNKKDTIKRDFWVSIDCTFPRPLSIKEKIIEEIRKLNKVNKVINLDTDIYFHEYKQSDLVLFYPALKPITLDKTVKEEYRKNQRSIAWGMHIEPINYWYRKEIIKNNDNNTKYYNNIWVIEDDVGFSNSITNWISYYSTNKYINTDVLTLNVDNISYKSLDFCHYASKNYDIKYQLNIRKKTKEHCQRLSTKFLNHLHYLGIEEGCHKWSEEFVPTCCIIHGFTFSLFEKNHIGEKYDWNKRVNQAEWERIKRNSSELGKIYHALKF